MRKSGWISFCGWAAIASLLLSFASAQVYQRGAHAAAFSVITFLAVVLALPCAGLWLLGTIVHRSRARVARMNAEAIIAAQQRSNDAKRGVIAVPAMRPARAGEEMRTQCSACNRTPVAVWCTAHQVWLCATCWNQHHVEGRCVYVQRIDLAGAGATGPKSAAG